MTSPDPAGDWTPPADPVPAVADTAPPAVAEPAPVPAPPVPTEEVSTGPVAEAPPDTEPAPAEAPPATAYAGDGTGAPAASVAEPVPTVTTASNAATTTPEQSARHAAAKAFHVLGRIADAARELQAEIEKHVPPEVLSAAETEAVTLLRSLL